jgi:SAM-dependent methyltransferase
MRVVTAHAPADEPLPESGYAVCNHCNTRYPIREHILDLASHATYPLTVAGRSNLAPFAPQIYEKVWRPRALSLLTGKKFPPTLELARLREWAQVKVGDLVLDVGTSTGFYARGLATVDAEIVALDHARGMLQTARAVARRKGFNRLAYLRAFAQALPFADAGVDVIVCGGSLNEFASMAGAPVLEIAHR